MKHVESLFFGNDSSLFGLYHPATGRPRNHGIVVCAPLFHEYYRSHFTIRRIAEELAQKGYEVLRFDYSGTGDSKGEIPPDMFNTWSADIGEAMTEIRRLGGCKKVSLIASRFSASLGLPWEAQSDTFICWDSILDHCHYVEQLDATNCALLAEHPKMSAEERLKCTEEDFLGIGMARASITQMLSNFAERHDTQDQEAIANRAIEIRSDFDWVSASLKMIHAHDTVKQVADAL